MPLTGKTFSPGLGMDFWDIGLSVAEVAAMGAAAEMITGILRMRAPGMSLARLPLFAWSMLVTGVMIIFAFTPLIVGTALLELDRKLLTRFFDPAAGGKPLLWQHLFWMFGHPEVYIMFLPAAGIVSQVVQTFARRPVVGYRLMVLSMVGHRRPELHPLDPPHVHDRALGAGARHVRRRRAWASRSRAASR